MSLAVLPDRSVLHTSRDGELRITDAAGNTTARRQARRLLPRRGGPPRRRRRPRTSADEPLHLPLLRAPAEHPGGRRPRDGHRRRLRALRRRQPALPVRAQRRRHPRQRQREEGPRRPRLTAACAATSAATSTSTRRATCTCRPATTPTPSQSDGFTPIDERAEPQPGLRRPALVRQHQRPARQDPAHQGRRGRLVHRPRRQPVRARHGQDAPRDLRDGLPQPVPLQRRQGDRHPSTSATTVPTRARPTRPAARPARSSSPGSPSPATSAGPTAPATTTPYVDYDFATGTSGAAFDCAAPKNDSPNNTGLTDLPPGPGRLDPVRRRVRTGVRRRLRVPDGRPGLPLRRGPRLPGQVPGGVRRRLLRR